jgi:predicted acetyltransferase
MLNKNLEEFGGHIGYEVRPSARRKGIATEMLRLVLQTPKAREIRRVLLTCAPDNEASNRTIRKNGGILNDTRFVEKIRRQTNYYWIEVPTS